MVVVVWLVGGVDVVVVAAGVVVVDSRVPVTGTDSSTGGGLRCGRGATMAPMVVPCPPESGAPRTHSTPVITSMPNTNATMPPATSTGHPGTRGVRGGRSSPVRVAARTATDRAERRYSAAATVLTTLAIPAPSTVPVTPRLEPIIAAVTAAKPPANTSRPSPPAFRFSVMILLARRNPAVTR